MQCHVLRLPQRIRGFTTMRYINIRFTYLLTYLAQFRDCTACSAFRCAQNISKRALL